MEEANATEPVDDSSNERDLRAGFVFIDRDVELLKFIYDYRFLRRDQLSILSGRPMKRLHRRLHTLHANGYLSSIKLPQQKHIYGLSKKAQGVLVEEGIANEALLQARLRTHELKELFLKHEMMIVDIHVALGLASQHGPVKLVSWKEGRELFDKVPVHDPGGVVHLPVRPDAFFSLEDNRRPEGGNRLNFFLEADRSTTTQTRFQEKVRAYWHYFEQGLHTKKHHVRYVRVVTITLTDERARNLSEMARVVLPERARKYFLFGVRSLFAADNPAACFDPVFRCPRDSDRVPLVSPPANLSPI